MRKYEGYPDSFETPEKKAMKREDLTLGNKNVIKAFYAVQRTKFEIYKARLKADEQIPEAKGFNPVQRILRRLFW